MINNDDALHAIEAQGLTESKYRIMAAVLGVPNATSAPIGQVMETVISGSYREQASQIARNQRVQGDRS